jgi:hypothetical protein
LYHSTRKQEQGETKSSFEPTPSNCLEIAPSPPLPDFSVAHHLLAQKRRITREKFELHAKERLKIILPVVFFVIFLLL